jgi:Protein of unknown function (DUF3617)
MRYHCLGGGSKNVKKILLAIVTMYPLATICPVAMRAQDIKLDVKPGLWENTTTSQISGLQMPANMPQLTPDQLSKMPPDARARVEAMMKGGPGAPQTNTSKVCLTSQQLSGPMFPKMDKSCAYKLTGSSSSSQNIHVECAIGSNKTSGDLTFNRVDSEHLKGDMLMKATGDSSTNGSVGQNMTIKLNFSNKWLSSDCGDVKPASSEK